MGKRVWRKGRGMGGLLRPAGAFTQMGRSRADLRSWGDGASVPGCCFRDVWPVLVGEGLWWRVDLDATGLGVIRHRPLAI